MSEREWNRYGLPSEDDAIEREWQELEARLWADDYLNRTKDEGVFAL